MRLVELEIRNFRGIRELKWTVAGRTACLVGPGDSTKTTILDAIDLALTRRWRIGLDDSDFYDCDTSVPIQIYATVAGLPKELSNIHVFGTNHRAWTGKRVVDEPIHPSAEPAVTVMFSADDSLEPMWTLYTERNSDPPRVSARHRALLGVARIDDYSDRHLGWTRDSALSNFTEGDADTGAVVAKVNRAARAGAENADLSELADSIEKGRQLAADLGVRVLRGLRPALDPATLGLGGGHLSVHDGPVPFRRRGLGSKRLLAAAFQLGAANGKTFTLLDEIEHGLEPHRLRNFVKQVTAAVTGQALFTTHSPVVLLTLEAEHIAIVRSVDGITTVRFIEPDVVHLVRRRQEAFLARKILVCEGDTEKGLVAGFEEQWAERHPLGPLANASVAVITGVGSEASKMARQFASLGYDTAVLCDGDDLGTIDLPLLKSVGAKVFHWDAGLSTEEQFAADLARPQLRKMLLLAIESMGVLHVRNSLAAAAEVDARRLAKDDWEGWMEELGEQPFRVALGKAAKSGSTIKSKVAGRITWFYKSRKQGHLLSRLLSEPGAVDASSSLARVVEQLRIWAYDG